MDSLVGQQLGNYRVIRSVGQGGFAHVYLGEHVYLQTQAALKVLRLHLGQEAKPDFLHEAQTIAHLEHPHIVRVLEYGVEGDVPFLVMHYAPNGTLRQRHLKGTCVPVESVLSYVQQVASALDYAHRQRLIHRDVKPENMLLGRQNEVLLSDFGLVQLVHSTGSQTEQTMAGTLAYMAPEQVQGKPRPASDQYSLGISVYEWLSGRLPFQGTFAAIASQHLLVPPPPIAGQIPGISPDLEQVVFKALMKDPQQRFVSMQAFADAFAQTCQATEIRSYSTIAGSGALKSNPALDPPTPSQISTEIISTGRSSSNPSALETGPYQSHFPGRISAVGGSIANIPSTHPTPYQAPPPVEVPPSSRSAFLSPHSRDEAWQPATPEQQTPPKRARRMKTSTMMIALLLLMSVGGAFVLGSYLRPTPPSSPVQGSNGSPTANSTTPTASAVSLTSVIPASWHEKDDPLSDNSRGDGWDELFTIYRACQFQHGDYQVQETGGGGSYALCLARNTNYSDFAFEVQMKALQGTGGGIVFRAGSTGEYYFSVVQQDDLTITLFVKDCSSAGPCKTLKNVTSNQLNGLFRKGPNDLNNLAVVARGSTFAFFVNEQEVAQLTDNTYSQGQIGLGVGTASSELIGRTVEMRNAKKWTP